MGIKRIIQGYQSLKGLLGESQKQSYFKKCEQKSRPKMLMDHLRWFLKYGEINHYYYAYGFDVKYDIDIDQYFSKKESSGIRDQLNKSVCIGDKNASYICLLRDKFVFCQYLKSLGFKVPTIIGLCDKKTMTYVDTGITEPLDALEGWGDGEYFVKEVLGGCGEGVYPIHIQNHKIVMDDSKTGLEGLRNRIQDTCIVQEKVCQHPIMSQLNPDSANTLRLVTAMKDDEPVVISGIVRIGVQSSRLDNWSAGGISVGVNINEGVLLKYGLRRPEFAERLERHPHTNITFGDFEIPLFEKATEAAIGAHRMFYGIHSVGWDIAITEDGPVFIEGNNHWEVPMMQVHDTHIKENYLATVPKSVKRL